MKSIALAAIALLAGSLPARAVSVTLLNIPITSPISGTTDVWTPSSVPQSLTVQCSFSYGGGSPDVRDG